MSYTSPSIAARLRSALGHLARMSTLAALVVAGVPASAANWSDTEIQYLHGNSFNDNGVVPGSPKFSKDILTLQHASGFNYGRNFFFVDLQQSDEDDGNSFEIYGEYYFTLSMTKLAKADWSKNFIKDINLTAGINAGTKNDEFGANARVLLIGPTIDFNIPGAAFFSLDILAYIDKGRYNGFGGGELCGKHDTTYQITPAWLFPFTLGSAKFEFTGFVDFIGSRGDTCKSQILTQPQLRWDVGNHWGSPSTFLLGVEWQYWHNKFGNDGVNESFPQLLLVYKF